MTTIHRARGGRAMLAAAAIAVFAGAAAPAAAQLTPPPGPVAPTQAHEIFALPFTITQGGSYRLGRDLTAAAPEDFITVAAEDVTIDFAGHTLDGAGVAQHGVRVAATGDRVRIVGGQITRTQESCINANFRGVVVEDMRLSNSAIGNGVGGANGKPIVVRNVVVENVGANGVSFSLGSVLENVTVRGAGGDGFNGNGESVLRACVTTGCGGRGFHTAHGATLEGCTADRNDEAGFEVGPASVLRGCRATANGFGGRDRSRPSLPEGVTPIGVSGRIPHPFDGYTDPEVVDRRTGAPLPGLVNLGRGGQGERTPTSGFDGIRVGADSLVVDCVSSGNFDDGIAAGARSTVSRCTANGNDAGGIAAGSFGVIDGCTASGNGAAGVTVGLRSSVTGCRAANNTLTGFVIDDFGVAERCVATTNGGGGIELDTSGAARECDAFSNSGAGIQVHGNDSLVIGCTARANIQAGIEVRPGTGSRVEMNHICNNGGAGILINGSFSLVVRNHLELDWIANASGATSNTIGPIVGPGADLSTVGPWANIVFE